MSEFSGTDKGRRELMKGQKAFSAPLVAKPQAAMVVEPRQAAFHYPSRAAQAAAMGALLRARQLGPYTARPCGTDVLVPTVRPVALEDSGTEARPATGPLDRWNRVQQCDGDLAVGHVGGCHHKGQRQSRGIDDQMALYAVLAAIRGVRPRVSPPKTARAEALSMTARDRSTRPSLPKAPSTQRQTASQTPASVHRRNRRQQVVPSPHPSSAGRSFQAQPVRSTKTMPTRHLRSGMRGRPPFGLGGSHGSSGAISFHRSSLTHRRAIGNPPLEGLWLYHPTSRTPNSRVLQ